MLTRLVTYIVVGSLLFVGGYYGHSAVLNANEIVLPYSLLHVYLFHAIVATIICIVFDLIFEYSEKFQDQLGFLYMGTMIFKIILFCVVFHKVLFYGARFSKPDSASMLIPIFLFLFFEVFFTSKMLNKKP